MWLENSLEIQSESDVDIKRQHHDTAWQTYSRNKDEIEVQG